MPEPLGLFTGRRLDDGTLAFYPAQDDGGGIGLLQVRGYVFPVTAPQSDWYIAQGHGSGHTGLDINLKQYPRGDVDLGQPVFATCNGLVVFAGMARGTSWGNLVITASQESGGLIFWRYAHLKDVYVSAGGLIPASTLIGTIGKGYADRYYAHLHLDCWRGAMIAAESWRAADRQWPDPLDVWRDAGFVWEWGSV
jgi:murein DD-endopeptidase MepM/ murein hydrolase activator NlpD